MSWFKENVELSKYLFSWISTNSNKNVFTEWYNIIVLMIVRWFPYSAEFVLDEQSSVNSKSAGLHCKLTEEEDNYLFSS